MTGPAVVLGVDSGGSGLRAVLGVPDGLPAPAPVRSAEPVRTGPRGIEAAHMRERLEPMVRQLLAAVGGGRLEAVVVGAAGMATLGDDLRDRLPSAFTELFGVRRVALAADAVTAYAGALGQRPGAVVAAGTGLIGLGTDLTAWRRTDGWGHLLGDCGSGAWIGRAGLEAAMRAFDGRRGGSAALRARAEEMFGSPLSGLPGQLYPRPDRPAVLAAFAPEVGRCAADGDPVAVRVLREAAGHIADAAAAVCPPDGACEVALTGGLLKLGDVLLDPLAARLTERLPHARRVAAAGDPLDGAVRMAADLATDTLKLPRDPHLLYVAE
ncbi:N-acetylglucosamine kinase [Streptomyces flavofungini]|uniref:N-acetylglucosamine kinase n=1 Tax=Streptomyces flavofungini TaxID=68200 RepID=UPI0025B03351|nr:BadF/BadG/BcrA/BcrD ATPase family protein [Streptomyces flavofungini]WJV44390.1 BadF/BadG/BcrA/BcrD ATPase family protein [Streptomyces flavofungini]